jgi:hypothetical protein
MRFSKVLFRFGLASALAVGANLLSARQAEALDVEACAKKPLTSLNYS